MSKLELIKAYTQDALMGRGYYVPPTLQELVELLAHIERLEATQIPEGHVAVPREPTTVMLKAAFDECSEGSDTTYKEAWAAMIQAATHGETEGEL